MKWSISASQVDAQTWDIAFKATIDKGWHVYAQEHYGDDGPMPTVLAFDTVPNFTLSGTATESGESTNEGIDPVFEMKGKACKGRVRCTQRIRSD